ncbi:MAG TPA: aminoacetone oxidase family FAD-binding enzyme, partial [Campylobacterales bacterium]|nr:aminoacetone oxidase family FAD-binding enzyme [Campylobacterales bacterium]
MKNQADIVILGAGASGLMLGSLLKKRDFLIIDNNPKIGAKILISGGGRCNITNGNVKPKNFVGEQRFVRNVIKRFDQHALLAWLGERGLEPIVRKRHQYFCEKSAKEMTDVFAKEIDRKKIQLSTEIQKVEKRANGFEVFTSQGKVKAKQVVVATGGLSFSKLGATGIGYEIAKSFGHEVSTLSAGLVGFTVQPEQFFFKSLSGIATEVKIRVGEEEIHGSLLFTHKGISGPAVLDASLYWQKGKITIDFMPTLNIKSLKSSKKNLSNVLGLASRVAKTFLDELGIEDKSCNQLSAEEWLKIERFKAYSFAPAGTFGYSKAEVTKGGVMLDE